MPLGLGTILELRLQDTILILKFGHLYYAHCIVVEFDTANRNRQD